jgi:ADP-ribose pyrophosphatase
MEPGESPIRCAKRELEEETGLVARQWINLGRTHILPAYTDEIIHIFMACQCAMTRLNPDQDEIIEVNTYSYWTLRTMIETGSITDALTILALYRAGERLKPSL